MGEGGGGKEGKKTAYSKNLRDEQRKERRKRVVHLATKKKKRKRTSTFKLTKVFKKRFNVQGGENWEGQCGGGVIE